MALTRTKKEQVLGGYTGKVARAQVMVWANYSGITVAQIQDLRKRLRACGAEAAVVKNSLMRKSLEAAHMSYDASVMTGPCVVAFIYDEIPAAIKVLNDFARERDVAFQLKGGLVGGKIATLEQIKSLLLLPSREVMLGRTVGAIQAPISGFVGVLAGILRTMPNVLNARVKQLEGAAN